LEVERVAPEVDGCGAVGGIVDEWDDAEPARLQVEHGEGGCAGGEVAGGVGADGAAGVRRPGLHRRAARGGGGEARDRAVGREAAAGQAGVRAAAAAVVVERCFAWLARDYERLASTLKGMHLAAFAIVMLARLANWTESS